jgi:hypothetical protein
MKINNAIRTLAMRKYHRCLSVMLAFLLLASSFPVKGGTSLATPDSMTQGPVKVKGSDFVYVFSSINSFGLVDSGGEFRGPEFTFNFPLPNTVKGKGHVMLQAKGVNTTNCNRFEINGTQIGVLIGRNSSEFVIEMNDISAGVLKPGNNTLRIASRNLNDCSPGGSLDSFAITNVVIFYQTETIVP